MLTIALLDEDVIMRLGLSILLNSQFKKIKIFEANDLTHYNFAHQGIVPDLLVVGNYESAKKAAIQTIQEIRDYFPLTGLIVYDYKRLNKITGSYARIGVRGHLLRQNIGVEFINCVRAVQKNDYFVSPDLTGL